MVSLLTWCASEHNSTTKPVTSHNTGNLNLGWTFRSRLAVKVCMELGEALTERRVTAVVESDSNTKTMFRSVRTRPQLVHTPALYSCVAKGGIEGRGALTDLIKIRSADKGDGGDESGDRRNGSHSGVSDFRVIGLRIIFHPGSRVGLLPHFGPLGG